MSSVDRATSQSISFSYLMRLTSCSRSESVFNALPERLRTFPELSSASLSIWLLILVEEGFRSFFSADRRSFRNRPRRTPDFLASEAPLVLADFLPGSEEDEASEEAEPGRPLFAGRGDFISRKEHCVQASYNLLDAQTLAHYHAIQRPAIQNRCVRQRTGPKMDEMETG
jgi:hypothetical protein